MNKDEFVTKKQLSDYSQYLVKEIASTKNEVKSAISKGNMPAKKLEQLLEYYEELNNTNTQVAKYLDYLADKIQVVVNENKSLKLGYTRNVQNIHQISNSTSTNPTDRWISSSNIIKPSISDHVPIGVELNF